MKKLFLSALAVCSCFFTVLQAQWSAGISSGYTHNEFYTNISNYQYNYYRQGSGFTIDIPVQYSITSWLAVQAEPGFIQKGFSLWFAKSELNESSRLSSHYNYLQLPLMAQFSISKNKWQGFVNIGAFGSYWLSGHIKGTQPDQFNDSISFSGTIFFPQQNVDAKYEFNSTRDRRLQFGWLAGVGLRYSLNNKLALFAEARYCQDVTDQQKKYMRNQMPRYNYSGILSAGMLFNLSTLHKHQ